MYCILLVSIPVEHYGLAVGLLEEGDPADFIIVEDLTDFKVKETYIDGQLVAKDGAVRFLQIIAPIVNQFNTSLKKSIPIPKICTSKPLPQ